MKEERMKSYLCTDIMKWACRIAELGQEKAPDILVLQLIESLLKSTYALIELMPKEIIEKVEFDSVAIKDLIGESEKALAKSKLNTIRKWEEEDFDTMERASVMRAMESLRDVVDKVKDA